MTIRPWLKKLVYIYQLDMIGLGSSQMPISLGFQREVVIDETKIRETSERERANGNRSIYIYASACASAPVIPVCTGDNSRSSFLAHLGSLLLGYANKINISTPERTAVSDDDSPSITTFIFLLVRKDLIQFSRGPRMP